MAITCGFFNSVEDDRLYNAEQMSEPYAGLISNGVLATPKGTPSDQLQVLTNDGMMIIVNEGRGMFDNRWLLNDDEIIINVPDNTELVPRYDSVIVRIDNTPAERRGSIILISGKSATNPIPPAINTQGDIVEYRLANIYVKPGVTEITQDLIYDTRGSKDCPWVTSLVQQVDTSTLFAQWQTAYENFYNLSNDEFKAFMVSNGETFDDWMDKLRGIIPTAAIVKKFTSSYTTATDRETTIPINIPNFAYGGDILNVYINGMQLLANRDYVVDNAGTIITLANAVLVDTQINFEVLKSVDGENAESVVDQVAELQQQVNGLADRIMPVGTIVAYSGNVVPDGYIIARGQAVSRTVFADLFTIFGTTYGKGDGVTTFNLPDLRRRIPVGWDDTDTNFNSLGKTGGDTSQELRALMGASDGLGYRWSYSPAPAVQSSYYGLVGELSNGYEGKVSPVIHSTLVLQDNGQNATTLQPYITTNYIIRY